MEVKKNGVSMASFVYAGDGKQVKSTVNGVTTYFVGAHYQVENGPYLNQFVEPIGEKK